MNELIINQALLVPADKHPAKVYVGSLASGSRRTMITALENIAQIFQVDAMRLDWTAIRYQHVQTIRAHIAELYAPATANRHLAALRGVLKESWRLGYMTAEEYQRATDFKLIKGERDLMGRYIEAWEFERLIDTCYKKRKTNDLRDACMLSVLYVCGLRREELVTFALPDYEQTKIRVIGKGNKERRVPVNEQLQPFMAEWLQLRGDLDGAFFTNLSNGEPLTTDAVYSMVVRRGAAAGIASLSPHDLRHAFISNLFDQGVDISTIADLAGHDSVEQTRKYDRRPERARANAVEKLFIPGLR